MIPPKTVQEIFDAVRIEEVVEDFVTLRKRGVNLLGLCPFHNEKSPSFNVNPTRNIFKCFGCGKGGTAVDFLMEHERFTYPEALRWLARRYNIEIQEVQRTPEQMAVMQAEESLYIVNDFAVRHFQEQLFETDEGKSVALTYFKKRGLREETIRTFGLGYAPDQRTLLLDRSKKDGHSVELLRQVGLCNQEATRDFFRARVMFSIHSLSGKVAAFAGRTMSTDKTVPKYVNSPETAIYVKNKILFGAFQAKKAIRQFDECILVEGYMDVISLWQAGIENVVASSGTSLTEGQLNLIKRNTDNLKILYDGDPAGIKAALRGLDLALEQDLNVKIVLLPNGEDPDSYVQQIGAEAFKAYIAREAKDFILFKTGLLLAETQGDPIKRAGLVKDIVSSIARMPDPIKRSVYLRECAGLLEISEETLVQETNKLIAGTVKKRAEREARQPGAASDSPSTAAETASDYPVGEPEMTIRPSESIHAFQPDDAVQERDVVRLLIQFGGQAMDDGHSLAEHLLINIEDSLEHFDQPLYGKIAKECFERVLHQQELDQAYFTQHPDLAVRNLALELLQSPWELSPNWEARWGYPLQNQPMPELNFKDDLKRSLYEFKQRKLMKMREQNRARIQATEQSGDMENLMHYLKVQMKLDEAMREIVKITGTVALPTDGRW
jgi:DNA primase